MTDRVEEIRRRLEDIRLDRELAHVAQATVAADRAVELAKAERPTQPRRTPS